MASLTSIAIPLKIPRFFLTRSAIIVNNYRFMPNCQPVLHGNVKVGAKLLILDGYGSLKIRNPHSKIRKAGGMGALLGNEGCLDFRSKLA